MTEPSQYFKGRTVQEQMNEVIGYVDVRSAEVATDAIAADVAQVHQDMLDADADASAAAASAAAAAGTLSNAVKKTGEASQSIAGNIEVSGTLKSTGTLYAVGDASVGGNLGVGGSTNVGDLTATGVVTVPTPTGNNYAANKKYVDDKDALKISITDINNYAVGLTGNQTKAGQLILTSGLTLKAYQAETIEATNGPRIGTNAAATQVIMRLYQNANDTDYVTRDTVFQSANTKNVSRIWYLQRQNEAGDGVESISLSLTFNAQGRASLTITDSQGTRTII